MPAFVEGRILYDQGKYEEALPAFEEAVAAAQEARRDADPGAALLCRRDADAARSAAGGRSGIPERSCGAFRRTSAPGQPSRRCITRRDSRTPRTPPSPTCCARHPRRRPTRSPRACGPRSASPARRRRSAPKRGARFPKAARPPRRTTNKDWTSGCWAPRLRARSQEPEARSPVLLRTGNPPPRGRCGHQRVAPPNATGYALMVVLYRLVTMLPVAVPNVGPGV